MKKILSILFIASMYFVSCSKDDLNLATDINPRVLASSDLSNVLNQIESATSDEERGQILSENNWVTARLIAYARDLKQIPLNSTIDSVVYYFGSAEAQAEDVTGKLFKGKIVNETIGFIYFNSKREPVAIIVYCQNGTFGTLEDLSRIGVGNIEFTISQGEGINHHVDYATSILLAEHFSIPVFRGRKMISQNQITYQTARTLESDVANTQVTVLVYPGDYFNMGTMTYQSKFR